MPEGPSHGAPPLTSTELDALAGEARATRLRLEGARAELAELRRLLAALVTPSAAPEAAHPTLEAP